MLTNRGNNNFVIIEARRKHLMSQPNYHTTKTFSDNLFSAEMKRTQIVMNKSAYLDSMFLSCHIHVWE